MIEPEEEARGAPERPTGSESAEPSLALLEHRLQEVVHTISRLTRARARLATLLSEAEADEAEGTSAFGQDRPEVMAG